MSQSLIDELEEAVARQDLHRRAAVMRRLTDFFIVDGAGMSEDHIAMLDDVMSRLIVAIDQSARAEFGELLARHPNAPKTSRILALDDEITVAAPVLTHSRSLDDETLIETAKTKSQDHLFAITLRNSIGEAVTDVLVERGNSKVVVSAAGNPGAKFSDFRRHGALPTRSRDDAELALRVWSRSDIPRQHLLSLFSTATEEVQKQLETADRKNAQLSRSIVAQARNQIQARMREGSASYAAAQPVCRGTAPVRRSDRRTPARIRATGKV